MTRLHTITRLLLLAIAAIAGIILNAILPGGFGRTLKIYPDKGDKDEFTDEDR